MGREGTRKDFNQPADEAADPRARALGMLELLLSAQASAELHRVDKDCMAQLEKCVARLRAAHAVAQRGIDDEFLMVETSLPGLLRLLVYLQAEAADSLQDAVCAAHLERCVTRLLRTHRLSPEQLCTDERPLCH